MYRKNKAAKALKVFLAKQQQWLKEARDKHLDIDGIKRYQKNPNKNGEV